MKKKRGRRSEETEVPESSKQLDNYVVGQVSGSLFPSKTTAESSTLASLFNTKAGPAGLVCVPAPKPDLKRTQQTAQGSNANTERNVSPPARKKQRLERVKTAAEKKTEDRECALKNADEEEGQKKAPAPSKQKLRASAASRGTEQAEGRLWQSKVVNKAEERMKNKRTVFVGNLPVTVTKKMMKAVFKEYGSIESVRFRSVAREDKSLSRKAAAIQRKVHPKRNSINAYVVFKAEEGAVNALQRNGMEIEKGYYIRVDRASKSASYDNKRSIFVGNLPYDINELPFRELFEECGSIEAVRLVRDRETAMGKGFGYVLFESADAVQLALKLDNSELMGRRIRVKRSVRKQKEKPAAPARSPRGGAGTGPRGAVGAPRRKPGFGGKRAPAPWGDNSIPLRGRPTKALPGPSFTGEMAKPGNERKKNKGLKKKFKPKKGQNVHI
uniref:RNA binding motif protein 34 n=1 Tax=Lepisosteus oculatus TaxID=7918 RepID=W5NG23_LEPOC